MSSGDESFNYGAVAFIAFLLLFAVTARFVSISHQLTLDWSVYEKVLEAFFRTPSRSQVFLVQFAAAFLFAALFPFFGKKEISVYKYAYLLFILVSVLRYFVPTFVVSIIGDLLAIIILLVMSRSFSTPKAALTLYIIAVFLLVPKGLWRLTFAWLIS